MCCDMMSLEYDRKWFPLQLPRTITLRSHTPPNLMKSKNRLRHKFDPMSSGLRGEPSSPLERVLDRLPLPGTVGMEEIKIKLLYEIEPPDEDRQRLFIAEIISAHISQMEGNANGMKVVAELFDPLTFFGKDASVHSDMSYISTATAYELLKDLQGKLIPKYYGSYTMKVPVEDHPKHKNRDVRVILRSYIEGVGLKKIDPKSLNRDQKQRLMEKLIEVEQEFDNRGVGIRMDYSPRSVILVDKKEIRIAVWSLRFAKFGPDLEQPTCQEEDYIPGKFASPLLKWTALDLDLSDFDIFVDWDWLDWMKKKYGGTQTLNGTTEENH
ncbi:hypothetical protein TRVA0_001S02784 [Trichomonascus vanleenenianus]|uniref:uncharacterized protein n=1 Tax=Trichomonascus vanleenenianus TaxID=2268995 RepID=UPI003EC9B929